MKVADPDRLCMGCMCAREEPTGPCPHCEFDQAAYEPLPHQLPCRSILNGKYLTGRVLGQGGFGITYVGWDLILEMRVAIKEYYPSGYVTRDAAASSTVYTYTGDAARSYERGKDRFMDEARVLAKFFSLPGIVSVKDFFLENNTAYIVMEYLDGVTLKEYLAQKGGRIPAQELLDRIRPVLQSLQTVHKANLIHRDISPDNIMVLRNGQVKLLDFGAARDVSVDGEKSLSVLLKPGYAPEEQYRTHGEQGPWTDVYALCATLYKCLTGMTPTEPLERAHADSLEPPAQCGAATTPQQDEAIMKGLALDAANRFRSMQALEQALYGGTIPVPPHPEPLAPEPTAPVPPTPVPPAPDQPKRKRFWIPIAAGALAVVLVAVLAGRFANQRGLAPAASSRAASAISSAKAAASTDALSYGTTMNNLISGGVIARDGDTVYYAYGKGIFSYQEDPDQAQQVLKGVRDASCLQMDGNDLYFIDGEDDLVHKWSFSEHKGSKLTAVKVDSFAIYKEKIYYIRASDSTLWKMGMDGSADEKVSSDPMRLFMIVDGRVYYVAKESEAGKSEEGNLGFIKRMNLDGSGRKQLVEKASYCFQIDGDWLYYSTQGSAGKPLYRQRLDGKQDSKLPIESYHTRFAVSNGALAYADTSKKMAVADLDGQNVKRMPDVNANIVYALKGEIFGLDKTGNDFCRTTLADVRAGRKYWQLNTTAVSGSSSKPASSRKPAPSSSKAASAGTARPALNPDTLVYNNTPFSGLDSVISRIANGNYEKLDKGESKAAENKFIFVVHDMDFRQYAEASTKQDHVLVQVLLCATSSMKMGSSNFAVLAHIGNGDSYKLCPSKGYLLGEDKKFATSGTLQDFPLQVAKPIQYVTLYIPVPKGVTQWMLLETNTLAGESKGPLYAIEP